jgi:HEAT repeat protein
MGILDFFGGSGPAKALKLKAKVMQKYGDPVSRQKAIQQLGELQFPEAVTVLLSRFTVTVEPQTTDADEKEQAFELVRARGAAAVPSVTAFLARTDLASSWAVRLLAALLPETEVVAVLVAQLQTLAQGYTRNPEKRLVLLDWLSGKDDPRIAPAVLPFLEDMSDDVRLAALRTLGPLKYQPAREPMLQLLTAPETGRRVQVAAIEALADSGFGVQGFREKVEALAPEPFFVDKAGVLKRRGAPDTG